MAWSFVGKYEQVLTFHEKFTCIKTINVRKKDSSNEAFDRWNELNNYIPSNSVVRDKKNVSRGNIHKKKLV